MPVDRIRLKELFGQAIEISPQDRAAFLDLQCGRDLELRHRLEVLLAAHDQPAPTLDEPWGRIPDAIQPSTDMPLAPADQTDVGTVVAGKYKLLQRIGEGGMGAVWMADQTEPVKRRVAVKLIHADRQISRTILSRFEAERQAIALMDHPHIAKLLDAGTTEAGAPYFVMELVKGVPLTEYADAHRLSVPERLNLFIQICSAVQHAHQKGVIHRDLKPSNILVESHDGKAIPKVIDFGLAKATSSMALSEKTLFTGFGSVMGTPLYMAPEQATFNAIDVDTRADIYALGVILYELLTGTTPITREMIKQAALDEMLKLVREQEAPTPSTRLSSADSKPNVAANRQIEPRKLGRLVKGELDWIVLKALAKERDRRYDSANGFARDIERFLNHEPVLAGPPGARYRLQKFVRRNRPQVIAAMLVLLALLAGIGGTTFGLIRADRAWSAEASRAEGERRARDEAREKQGEAERQTVRALAGEKLAGERLVQVNAEKVQAEKERLIAKAALDFLQNKLLGQADARNQANALLRAGEPLAETKENPTIRELLDRAAQELRPEKIDASFPDQPQVQAQILDTVGATYLGIGAYERAISFLQRAVALRRRDLGADDAETLQSMNNLALAYHRAGQLPLALPLYEETFKLLKAKMGPRHGDTLTSMSNLANAYHDAGRLDLAISLSEETLKLQKAMPGLEDQTLISMNNLALLYADAGKLNLALPLSEEVLKRMKTALGPDHPDTLTCMNNLANVYSMMGKLEQAIGLSEEALKLSREKLGADHPDTLICMNSLAQLYAQSRNPDRAIPLLEETLRLRKEKLGVDHPATLRSMGNLANAYLEGGKAEMALPLYEQELKLSKSKLGPDHPQTLGAMNNLANVYRSLGKAQLALPLAEETFKLMKSRLGADHPSTLVSMNNLANAYQAIGRQDLAIPIYEEALKLQTAKLGADHPSTIDSMSNLAVNYWQLRQLDKSIPLFEQTLKRLEAKLGRDHPDTIRSIANLGVNYKDAGRFAEALPLLEEAHRAAGKFPIFRWVDGQLLDGYVQAGKTEQAKALVKEMLAGGQKETAQFAGELAVVGQALLKEKSFAEAQAILEKCTAIRETTQPDHWTTFNTKSMLGAALLGQKEYDKAEPLLLAGYEEMKAREAQIPAAGKIRLTEAIERLVLLYESRKGEGDGEKAASYRKLLP